MIFFSNIIPLYYENLEFTGHVYFLILLINHFLIKFMNINY